jgi:hypothetical protein
MMQELDCHSYTRLYELNNPFGNTHDYYYHYLQEFTSQNKRLIDSEGHKYGLHKEGIVNTINYNYSVAAFDYKFYYSTAIKYVLKKFDEHMCDPSITNKFRFHKEDLKKFLNQELTKSKKIYNATKWKYLFQIIKKNMCAWNPRYGYNSIKETPEHQHFTSF